MKKCNCPECGKELIVLDPVFNNYFNFYCDDCDIDIEIIKNKSEKEND